MRSYIAYERIKRALINANGNRRCRLLQLDEVIEGIYKASTTIKCWDWDWEVGGVVSWGYGYDATTTYAFICKISERRFAVLISDGDARGEWPFRDIQCLKNIHMKKSQNVEKALHEFVKYPGVITFDLKKLIGEHEKYLAKKYTDRMVSNYGEYMMPGDYITHNYSTNTTSICRYGIPQLSVGRRYSSDRRAT